MQTSIRTSALAPLGIGALPYLLLLACPLMHVFMHGGHSGGHGHGPGGSPLPDTRATPRPPKTGD